MAIEIIPKPKIKKIPLINIPYYLLSIVFLAFFISYFVLDFSQKKSTAELSNIEKALERSPAENSLEQEILGYQTKIDDFNLLINNHQFVVNLFDFLEKYTHPKVWFSKFELNSEKNIVKISGETDNFEILGQQTLIFEKQEFIKNLNLTEVSIGKEGKIKFDLQLTFDPQIFTPIRDSQSQTGQE